MAELLELSPSLEEIFANLSKWPKEQLLELQRKLQQVAPANSNKLLEAMILKCLGQKAAALQLLNSHPNVKAAQYIANAIQNDNIQCQSALAVPRQDSDLQQTLAQVDTLLQNQSRSGVCGKNSAQKDCNRAEENDEPHTLKSRTDTSPTGASPCAVSPAILIDRVNLNPAPVYDSLHSFSNLASVNSNLAISQSPTALFVDPDHHVHPPRTPSKLCNDITNCSLPQTLNHRSEFVNHTLKSAETKGIPFTDTVKKTLTPAPSSMHYPVECTDKVDNGQLVVGVSDAGTGQNHSQKETTTSLPKCDTVPGNSALTRQPVEDASHLRKTEVGERAPQTPSLPVEATSSTKEADVQDPASSPNMTLPSPEPENSENSFYSFVVLHVKEDEDIASRVRDTLERLGIADGTTFCDGFERPGRRTLNCLQDAIDNSAFTILLLTPRWNSHWTHFQMDTALMNAIEHKHKYNTVIPYLPQGHHNIPWQLKALTALDENSSTFSRTAKKTFTLKCIEKQKAIWRKEENIKALERKTGEYEIERDQNRRMQEIYTFMVEQQKRLFNQPTMVWPTGPGGATGTSPGFPPFSPFQYIPGAPGTVPPAIPPMYLLNHPVNSMPFQFCQPGPYGNPVYQQPPAVQQGTQYASGGQHPVIQIQHASNVQIGDQNQMRINRAEEEVESTQSEEDDLRL